MPGIPLTYKSTTWILSRTVTKRRCAVTKKIIWPLQKAWRKRIDTLCSGEVLVCFHSEWVSEKAYLIMKLKGEE